MSCPLGTFRNPETGKCILVHGEVAKDLVKRGIVNPYLLGPALAFAPQVQPMQPMQPVQQAPVQYKSPCANKICELGHTCNPITGRCRKLYRNTVKQPIGRFVPALQVKGPCLNKVCGLGQECNPYTGRCRKIQERKTVRHPYVSGKGQGQGQAQVAPFLDRESILGWAYANCRNTIDPITKKPFASQSQLTDMIRLHTGTCTLASGLHAKVAAERKAGRIGTIPGDPQTHMTADDFNALRDAMRRSNPAYKVPGHRHLPPPPEWKLYIASDNLSGPEFVSIVFLDITKAKHGPHGVQYPTDSIRINMGYLPIHVSSSCSLNTLIERIKQVHMAGKLLVPTAEGWKPIAGFPFKKEDWKHNATQKMEKLCFELTKALNMVV